MTINPKFEIGDVVYFVTDQEQSANIITGYVVRKNAILYEVSYISSSSLHYDFELSSQKNVLIACGVEVEN